MGGIGPRHEVLRNKLTPEQINQSFAAQDAALEDQVRTLLGSGRPWPSSGLFLKPSLHSDPQSLQAE